MMMVTMMMQEEEDNAGGEEEEEEEETANYAHAGEPQKERSLVFRGNNRAAFSAQTIFSFPTRCPPQTAFGKRN